MTPEEQIKELQRDLDDLRFKYDTVCIALGYEWSGKGNSYDMETVNRLGLVAGDVYPDDVIKIVAEKRLRRKKDVNPKVE